jgi:hypothetical protein
VSGHAAESDAADDDVVARLHAELDRRGVPRFSVVDMTPEQRNRLREVGVNLPPESSYTRVLPPGSTEDT